MNDGKQRLNRLGGFAALLVVLSCATMVRAQTTAFTYQGRLTDAGNPANSLYDLQFTLFDDTDTQQGPTLTLDDVQVSGGIFTVQLDFGEVFDGGPRLLEIAVRPGASSAAFTTLSPRQSLSSTPYALRSVTATNALQLGGLPPSSFVQFDANGQVGIGTDTPVTRLDVRGKLALDPGAGNPVVLYTASSGGEQNRYLELINSPDSPSASGLKAGGILIADNYNYAQPAKNDLVVKGSVGIGTAATTSKLSVEAGSGIGIVSSSSGANGISIFGGNTGGGLAGRFDGNVAIFGKLSLSLGSAGSTSLCRNVLNEIASCSSSLRYKKDVRTFDDGLKVIRQLQPIAFRWKTDAASDVGFGAEEVAKINPLFITRNDRGEVEGVKYDRLSVVFVNAFKEQQAEITTLRQQLTRQQQHNARQEQRLKQQQTEIDALKRLVCLDHRRAAICKSTR